MLAPFDLVPFDPANDAHQAFVYDTFRRSCAGVFPWVAFPAGVMMAMLKRELAKPGTETVIATPHGMPSSYLGWYSVRKPDVVVYAFTKYSSRRQGVATLVLREMGLDGLGEFDGVSIGVTFWTPACARLAGKGMPLYFDTRDVFDERER